MIQSQNVVMVANASEVDPDALARFRAATSTVPAATSPPSDAHQQGGARFATRGLAAVDPVSNAVVGEIGWSRIDAHVDEGDVAVFDRLVVAESMWSHVSRALVVAAAAELVKESIKTAVVPDHIAGTEFGALLADFGIRRLRID